MFRLHAYELPQIFAPSGLKIRVCDSNHQQNFFTLPQIAILNSRRGTNVKYLPFVFTEHGAIQAANVLRSERAVEMGIYVVRAFVQLRNLLASNKELAQQLKKLERKVSSHDEAIVGILKAIRQLMNPPEPGKRSIGFVELQEKKKT